MGNALDPEFDALVESLVEGERDLCLALVGELIAQGRQPVEIVTNGIEVAMAALDRKCTAEQFNLLEIMLAGRAVMAVIGQIFPEYTDLPNPRATVIVAALEGDIHDIGKSILKVSLSGAHIKVIDCGRDAPVAAVVRAAKDIRLRRNIRALTTGSSGWFILYKPLLPALQEQFSRRVPKIH